MVSLTAPAVDKVRQLLAAEGEEAKALRVAVRPGGCSGFSYEMFFDSQIDAESDVVAEYEGVKLVVDSASLRYLDGAQVDYRDGLQGAGFAINNPNVQRSCGCGNSFS